MRVGAGAELYIRAAEVITGPDVVGEQGAAEAAGIHLNIHTRLQVGLAETFVVDAGDDEGSFPIGIVHGDQFADGIFRPEEPVGDVFFQDDGIGRGEDVGCAAAGEVIGKDIEEGGVDLYRIVLVEGSPLVAEQVVVCIEGRDGAGEDGDFGEVLLHGRGDGRRDGGHGVVIARDVVNGDDAVDVGGVIEVFVVAILVGDIENDIET